MNPILPSTFVFFESINKFVVAIATDKKFGLYLDWQKNHNIFTSKTELSDLENTENKTFIIKPIIQSKYYRDWRNGKLIKHPDLLRCSIYSFIILDNLYNKIIRERDEKKREFFLNNLNRFLNDNFLIKIKNRNKHFEEIKSATKTLEILTDYNTIYKIAHQLYIEDLVKLELDNEESEILRNIFSFIKHKGIISADEVLIKEK